MSCPKLEIPNLDMPDFHQFKIYTNIINASVIKSLLTTHQSYKTKEILRVFKSQIVYFSDIFWLTYSHIFLMALFISDILKLHKIFFPIADFFHGFFLYFFPIFFYNSTIFFYVHTRKKYLAIN